MPTVASVTPADGTAAVQGGMPVRVELTRLDSTDVTKVETTQADFAAGTLVNAVARATNDLVLATGYLTDTFDAETIGSVPSHYTVISGTGCTVQTLGSGKAVRFAGVTDVIERNSTTKTDWDVIFQAQNDGASNTGVIELAVRNYISGGIYCYRFDANWVAQTIAVSKTVNGTTTWNFVTAAKTLASSTLYSVHVQCIGTALRMRLWTAGTAEPATWDINTTDSSVTGAGTMRFMPTASSTYLWVDNVALLTDPSGYMSSGSRISPAYALSGVGTFGTGIVQYDSTVPANTTLTLKISKDGTTWTTVASGDRIALWSEGDALSTASIYTQAELATTDTAVTPVLSEVRLIFMAMDPSLVEIDVGGTVFTVANGGLLAWNTRKYVSLVLHDPWYQDVFVETVGSWWDDYGPERVTVIVKYNGATISTTTFDTDPVVAWLPSGVETWWWASAIGGVYDGELWGTCWYFASKLEDYLVRGDSHWYVQFPPSTTFDDYYLIAHAFRCDTPLAGIVGQPVTHDVPASGVGNCWNRSDTPAMGIVQNWTRDDHAASGVVAVPMPPHDEALSGIVGLPLAKDTPAAGVVYEVNASNAIEVRVISVEEAAFLDAMGLLRQ